MYERGLGTPDELASSSRVFVRARIESKKNVRGNLLSTINFFIFISKCIEKVFEYIYFVGIIRVIGDVYNTNIICSIFFKNSVMLNVKLHVSRELKKKIAEENLQLAEQQKSHQEYLNRVVYKNEPTAAFYEQFNKGTR